MIEPGLKKKKGDLVSVAFKLPTRINVVHATILGVFDDRIAVDNMGTFCRKLLEHPDAPDIFCRKDSEK